MYVDFGIVVVSVWEGNVEDDDAKGGERREKREGEGAMKARYWSRT